MAPGVGPHGGPGTTAAAMVDGCMFTLALTITLLVEVFPHQIKMSAILISLPRRSHVEAWYYFLALAFLDNLGVQNETTISHNIGKKKVKVTFQVGK